MKLMIPFCILGAFISGCTNDDSTYNPPHVVNDASVVDSGHRPTPIFDAGPRQFEDGSLDLQLVEDYEMQYDGGSVITGTAHVYFVWYGDWSSSQAPKILSGLVQDISNSPYMNASKTYYQISDAGDAGKEWVTGRIELSGQDVISAYPYGKSITENDMYHGILSEIANGKLPNDPQGLYFFMSSSDVKMFSSTAGLFCSDYCGFHSFNSANGNSLIHYSFVGGVGQCLNGCSPQFEYQNLGYSQSPNGDWEADAMASVLMHELYEMLTDPNFNAWRDYLGAEVGDKCAWTYGKPFLTADAASIANVSVNGKDYLLQQEWINIPGAGSCVLSQ